MKDTNSGNCNSGNYNSGNCNSGNYNNGYCNSGNYNNGYCNSGYYNNGYCNSGNYNNGYCNSGYYNSGYYNSGNYNSGNYNSGNYNNGYYNSGDCNSGWFNTNEPKMRMFNKETDMTYSEFTDKYDVIHPDLHTCQWIDSDDMTDQEKKDITGWDTMGGYLKTMTYKEAWAEYWERASENDKKFFTTLPNFDSEIFKEITGIDVNKSKVCECNHHNDYKFCPNCGIEL